MSRNAYCTYTTTGGTATLKASCIDWRDTVFICKIPGEGGAKIAPPRKYRAAVRFGGRLYAVAVWWRGPCAKLRLQFFSTSTALPAHMQKKYARNRMSLFSFFAWYWSNIIKMAAVAVIYALGMLDTHAPKCDSVWFDSVRFC